MKKIALVGTLVIVLIAFVYIFVKPNNQNDTLGSSSLEAPSNSQPPAFDKKRYSIDDPSSQWIVVDKKRPISTDYVPANLAKANVNHDPSDSDDEQKVRQEIIPSVEAMFSDAKKQGFNLLFASGYRSAALQKTYYGSYAARDGQAAADRYSARPGTSEHQTGWAFDIARSDRKCYLEICFSDTREGKWLAANAYKYGFILRYQDGKEAITGYQYEPWHFRYVGNELAEQINNSEQTLEEFFGL